MSSTPPGPPTYSFMEGPSEKPPKKGAGRGLLIGALVFALIAAGFAGYQVLDKNDVIEKVIPDVLKPDPGLSPTPTASMPATDPKLARFYDQKLKWNKCERNLCTRLRVPLDYGDPN